MSKHCIGATNMVLPKALYLTYYPFYFNFLYLSYFSYLYLNYKTIIFETFFRLYRKKGALFRPPKGLPVFFVAPSFFLSFQGAFFRALFPPSFFFNLTAVFGFKSKFGGIFFLFLLPPSLRPPFFLLLKVKSFFYF